MNAKAMKWFVYSQSLLFFASSLIFPFYILFIKNVGSSYSQFGLAYGLFGLSGAFIHLLLGKLPETTDRRIFLIIHSFGMAFLLLLFPHITEVGQVYIIQLALGALGGFQKHGEKLLVTDLTTENKRMKEVGHYHFWTALFSSIAIMLGGLFADFFTVYFIFYASSILYLCSALMVLYIKNER
ncbi:MFS transporter [Bacillus safensis]|nr:MULTISPECIES: MFS transporter [Bacillus]TFV09826.1 MFS transporter [Bacillus stratosphericus]AYJ89644.1 MFS transporter [Bacillus safensis]MBI1628587.1 MFS transporter [Bacillus safensis]MBR0614261.1 MFS transporter [Bacillus safensis]MBR0634792.1 MFS transporter [Bacillus safensis]